MKNHRVSWHEIDKEITV